MSNYIIVNRTIERHIILNQVVVSGDSNSTTLTFTVDRFFDNIDLSTKTIAINYVNSLDVAGVELAGNVNTSTNGIMTFEWVIGRDVLVKAGEIYFAVEFSETNSTLDTKYVWQTKPTTFIVEQGLINDNSSIPLQYLDEISYYNGNSNNVSTTLEDASRLRIRHRDIELDPNVERIIIQNDTNSQLISFDMDRYYDGVDMSDKLIAIVFLNGNKEGGRAVAVDVSADEDKIYFGWLVDSRTTQYAGVVSFAVQVTGYQDGKFYVWQTRINHINIEEGILVNDDAATVDYLEQMDFYRLNNNLDIVDMIDEGLPLTVRNRTIEFQQDEDLVIERDNLSQLLTIVMPRYYDSIDFVNKIISVKYVNADGETDRTSIVNLHFDEYRVEFGWLLDSRVTKIAGPVVFAIEIIGLNEDGEPYIWQTKPASFMVEKGLNDIEGIQPPDPSWLESIYYEISKRANGLSYNSLSGSLQLTADGIPIGSPVTIILDSQGDMFKSQFATNDKVNQGYVDKAVKADSLMEPVAFSISGEIVSTSVLFDGTENVELEAVINNNIDPGTYTKVTVNNRGLVTHGLPLTADDIPDLPLSKITDAGTAAALDAGTEPGDVIVIGADGKIDPSLYDKGSDGSSMNVFVVDSDMEMMALNAKKGDMAVRRDTNTAFILVGEPVNTLASWVELPFNANFAMNFSNSRSSELLDGDSIVHVDENNHAAISVDSADALTNYIKVSTHEDSDVFFEQDYYTNLSEDLEIKASSRAVTIRGDFTPTEELPFPVNPKIGDTYKITIDYEWYDGLRIGAGGFITYVGDYIWEVLSGNGVGSEPSSDVKQYLIWSTTELSDWYANTEDFSNEYPYVAKIIDSRLVETDIAQVFFDIQYPMDIAYGLAPFVYSYDGYILIYCVTPPESISAVTIVTRAHSTVSPESITIKNQKLYMDAGETLQIQYEVYPPSADQSVNFTSLDTNVATIDEVGLVSGIDEGRTSIIVSSVIDDSVYDSVDINVYPTIITPTSITVSYDRELTINEIKALSITTEPANASKEFNFSSSDTSKVTVDASGNITGIGRGSSEIRVTSKHDANVWGTVNVNVFDIPTSTSLLSIFHSVEDGEIEYNPVVVTPGSAYWGWLTDSIADETMIRLSGVYSHAAMYYRWYYGLKTGVTSVDIVSYAKGANGENLFEYDDVPVVVHVHPTGIESDTEILSYDFTEAEYTTENIVHSTIQPRLLPYPPGGWDIDSTDPTYAIQYNIKADNDGYPIVRLKSLDTNIVNIVDNTKLAMTLSNPGATYIRAYSHFKSSDATNPRVYMDIPILVNTPAPQSFNALMGSTTYSVGGTGTLTVDWAPFAAPQETIYSSSDTSVATISDEGFITAKKVGTTTITFTAVYNKSLTYEAVVTVN